MFGRLKYSLVWEICTKGKWKYVLDLLVFIDILETVSEKKTPRHGHRVVMPCSCYYIANSFSSVVVVGTGEITVRTSERTHDTVGILELG